MRGKTLLVMVIFILTLLSALSLNHVMGPMTNGENYSQKEWSLDESTPIHNIYIYGNLTLNENNRNLVNGYRLIFEGTKNEFMYIDTNVTFMDETIISMHGNLSIVNTKNASEVNFQETRLVYNGSFSVSNSSIKFMNSIIGSRASKIGILLPFDNVIVVNSTFENDPISKSINVMVGKIRQGPQPISSTGTFSYSYQRSIFYNFPVSGIGIKINYSYSGPGVHFNTSFDLGGKQMNYSSPLLQNTNCYESNIKLNEPIFLSNLKNETVKLKTEFPYGSNLTVWKSRFVFMSNSTFNLTGFDRNYIVLYGSKLIAINSTFAGNSRPFMNGGYYDLEKNGFMLDNSSSLFFIQSRFVGNNLSYDSPVVTNEDSIFYFMPSLEVYYEMYNRTLAYNPKNISGENYAKRLIFKDITKSEVSIKNPILNESLLPLFIENSTITRNPLFSFTIFNITRYISFNENTIFSHKTYNYTTSFKNLISLNEKTGSLVSNRTINVGIHIFASENQSSNVTVRVGTQYANAKSKMDFFLSRKQVTKSNLLNLTIVREKSLYFQNLSVNVTLQFFNGIKNVVETFGYIADIPPEYYTFILVPLNLPSDKVFQIECGGIAFRSENGSLVINSTHESVTVEIMDVGFFVPYKSVVNASPGMNYIKFFKRQGHLIFEGDVKDGTNFSIGGHKYAFSLNESIQLPYGNYTLSIENSGSYELTHIYLHENRSTVFLSYLSPRRSVGFTEFISASLISPIIVAILYNLARKKLFKICPVCLRPTKINEKHHGHKK